MSPISSTFDEILVMKGFVLFYSFIYFFARQQLFFIPSLATPFQSLIQQQKEIGEEEEGLLLLLLFSFVHESGSKVLTS
jgi:hypothetical protein